MTKHVNTKNYSKEIEEYEKLISLSKERLIDVPIIFKEVNDSFLYTYNIGRLGSFWKVFCCNKVVQHFVYLLFCRNLLKTQKL